MIPALSPAMIAQIVLAISEVSKLAELLKAEDLTPEQKEAVKTAVRRANDLWERA